MKSFFLLLLCLSCLGAGSMVHGQSVDYYFRVYFTDKKQSGYSLSQPSQFLSQHSIDRRIKYGIALDSTDLPVSTVYTDSVLQVTGGILKLSSKWHNSIVIALADSSRINLLQGIAFFKKAKLVAMLQPGQKPAPDSTSGRQQAGKPAGLPGTDSFYGNAFDQIHLCNGEYLHQKGNMGAGIFIAVIDAGFSGITTLAAFDSLRENNRLADSWNYVSDTSWLGTSGHGTEALSCLAAYLPDTFVGTAPEATYALYVTDEVSTEQTIEEDYWTAAAERADSLGADMISSSLGYNYFDQSANSYTYTDLDGHSTYLAQTANAAVRKGIMTVVAAGNEGQNSWHYILTPGDADSAFTIGAVNGQKVPALYSGWGPNADGQRKPGVVGLGTGAAVVNEDGDLVNDNGTSFSTPIIAGLTACLMQAQPDLPPLSIRRYIISVSDHYQHPDDKIGYGIPDFKAAYNLITAIREQPEDKSAAAFLYPNPAGNYCFVQLKQALPASAFSLTDASGRKITLNVESYHNNTLYKINTASLLPGTYFLKIRLGNYTVVKKMVKIKPEM